VTSEGDPATSPASAGAPVLTGRRRADRRIRTAPVRSAFFRYAAPGVVTARAAAVEPIAPLERIGWRIRRALFGRLLASDEESEERLSNVKALATFSSDNLSSVAYATELIMFTLLAAGPATFALVLPISGLIVAIFLVIVLSYRQTIRAYPSGGGSYIVARENLGQGAGLVAAAALLTDYVLTVSVSVAAGVAAILSAFPDLELLRVPLCVAAIGLVMTINLRGIRDSGTVFAIPTYAFLVTTLGVIAIGAVRTFLGDVPHVAVAQAVVPPESLGVLLLMRAFADGCSAITGVEAVSNGVPAFKPPEWRNARTTLTVMGVLVATMFLGLSWLAGVVSAHPAANGETVISQIGRSVYGTGPVYYLFQLATTGVLILAANTSFADFPRLSSILARDGFMPRRFAFRGERLAFSAGIVVLAVVAIVVVVAFGGRVEALIPLYAIGVFTSITLSQAGMVRHWLRDRGVGWRGSAVINGFGAAATAIVTLIFAVAKFALGAWLIVLIIPVLVAGMVAIHRQYAVRRSAAGVRPEVVIGPPKRHQRVVIPVAELSRDVVNALKFARTMSDDVTAVHVTDDVVAGGELRDRFARQLPGVPFVLVESPYRQLVRPLVRFLEDAASRDDDDVLVVLLPEYVARHWWERLLYNQNARSIRAALLGRPDILVAEVPYRREPV
jgi:amino acid transporter